MIWRFFSLFLLLVMGGGLGYWLDGERADALTGMMLGALLAAIAWWALDAWSGLRVLAWLRTGDLATVPQGLGLWGETAERARRLLRERDRHLQTSEQRLMDFLSAIQASPNGVVLLNEQTQIEWCNLTAARQLGIDPQRDVMQRIGNLIRTPAFLTYLSQADASQSLVMEGQGHRPDRPVLIALQRHPYGEGKQLLLTRDVTSVEKADAMRRDFVANVSHEIRTPLTVLSGFVETLQTLTLTHADQQRYLGLMATQAQRMQSLVEDLLTLSRLEGGPSPSFQEALPLAQLISSCQQEAQSLSQQIVASGAMHALMFSVAPDVQTAQLLGNAHELQSALSNLVSNAVRYTPAGGAIYVQAMRTTDGGLQIAVQDTGPGIPAEHIPRLTERFYRVDRSRSRESGGTGLGLAIVKHVMQRHDGQLHIASVLGEGTTFKLVFPAARWSMTQA